MIRVVVHDEVIPAGPAPLGRQRPVPRSDLEPEAPGEPEAMLLAIEARDCVAIVRPEAGEVPGRPRVLEVKARIIRAIMPVPFVVIHVRVIVDAVALIDLRPRRRG